MRLNSRNAARLPIRAKHLEALLLAGTAALILATSARAQGFIYGRIYTESGNTYTGALRWNKEEAFWDDQFNATKPDNPNMDLLTADQRDNLRRGRRYDGRSWNSGTSRYWSNWANDWSRNWWSEDNTHQFVTRFGDLKALKPLGKSRVEVTLKNGERQELDGSNTNDVGATIQVLDQSLGLVKVDWDNIDRIEFMQAPANAASFGTPIYGTVKTVFGSFTGQIQWDKDEAVLSDELDGSSEDGKFSISFDRMNRIQRDGSNGVVVKLKDGRSVSLRGTNDVNSENRGIIVKNPEFGALTVEWKDFESLDLTPAPNTGPNYESYAAPKRIRGSITSTDGQKYTGELIYDLDETYDFELLNGNRGDSEYQIPFRLIKRIIPRDDESDVTLTSGTTLRLDGSQDVNNRHSGILVVDKANKRSAYLAWKEIREITFD